MTHGYFRGHSVVWIDSQMLYSDTMSPAGFGYEVRPCKKCGAVFEGSNIGKSDPCLGELPGVDNACCGHGVPSESYIRFTNGVTVRGFDVVEHPEG